MINPSTKRLKYILGMIIIFVLGNIAFLYKKEMLLDDILGILAINIAFLVVFVFCMSIKRIDDLLPMGEATNYGKIFAAVLFSWILIYGFSYCPAYFVPVICISSLLSCVLGDLDSLCLTLYYICILCFYCQLSNNTLYCYLLVSIIGTMLANVMKKATQREKIYLYIIYFIVSLIFPCIFYYRANHKISEMEIIYAFVNSVVSVLIIIIAFSRLQRKVQEEVKGNYMNLIDEDYPLARDIRAYSMAEYAHARRVSRLSAKCAEEIGADAMRCCVAGFYYRLGKMEGEPEIDNALRLANEHCFPASVMEIMEEYGCIIRKPQTVESAIVHMVDALVQKMEVLDADTMSSTWNQDMVTYQTLNELSGAGCYDESKLGMNQFLKIRECLVAEDILE